MSDNELYIVFYNCISENGYKQFYPIVSENCFFENIVSRGKYFDKHKRMFYPETNFKDNYTDIKLKDLDF